MSDSSINYADYSGMESVPGAAILAVVYVPLSGWFVYQSIGRPTYVFIALSLFCIIRVAAFIMRAILAGSESAGHNLGLLIADLVLFRIGFFGLLYSAYSLVLDRRLLVDEEAPRHPVLRFLNDRRVFRFVMVVAAALGIAGSSEAQSTDPRNLSIASALLKASIVITLVLTLFSALHTAILVKKENAAAGYKQNSGSFGRTHGAKIMAVVAALFIVRVVFNTATIADSAKQNNEHFWYPLVAVTEVVAAMLFAIPGLVPPRSELPK